jgi:hypothetical protein
MSVMARPRIRGSDIFFRFVFFAFYTFDYVIDTGFAFSAEEGDLAAMQARYGNLKTGSSSQ